MTIDISIPMPLMISVEDVGWWSGKDGSAFNQPFRTGMQRDHVPEDYIALAALGKGLDTRILSGFVLCEWDKDDLLKKLPTATWMGEAWTISKDTQAKKEQASEIIKKHQQYIELALHGVGHEFWIKGRMERTEFHNEACEMRDPDEIRKHLEYFFKLMDQYHFDFKPETFIPPALKHSFGNGDNGFQKILNEFGIHYVTLIFNRAKMYSKPLTQKVTWENNVLMVERGESEISWNTVAASPCFKFDRPVMALHWANILHPDPEKNMEVVQNWIQYIKKHTRKKGILLAEDLKSGCTQYLHRIFSKLEKSGGDISIDVRWMKKVPGIFAGKTIFLKTKIPGDIYFKIKGACMESTTRKAEHTFLKLKIFNNTKKICLKACT